MCNLSGFLVSKGCVGHGAGCESLLRLYTELFCTVFYKDFGELSFANPQFDTPAWLDHRKANIFLLGTRKSNAVFQLPTCRNSSRTYHSFSSLGVPAPRGLPALPISLPKEGGRRGGGVDGHQVVEKRFCSRSLASFRQTMYIFIMTTFHRGQKPIELFTLLRVLLIIILTPLLSVDTFEGTTSANTLKGKKRFHQ